MHRLGQNSVNPGGRDIYQCQIKQYLEKLYVNDNMLFNSKLPTDFYISFDIITLLLIKKGNLNLIHNQNMYEHIHDLSRKENWINYTMKYNVQSF